MCFKKCITKIDSGSLASSEESCMLKFLYCAASIANFYLGLSNCLNRFLDTNINIVKMIQQQQQ